MKFQNKSLAKFEFIEMQIKDNVYYLLTLRCLWILSVRGYNLVHFGPFSKASSLAEVVLYE